MRHTRSQEYIQPTEASYCSILVGRNFGDFRFWMKLITLSFYIYNVYICPLWIATYPLGHCKDTKKVEQCDAGEVFIHTKDMKIM